MNTPTLPTPQKRRLQAHFGFTGLPFRKNVQALRMFDSTSQRDLRHGLVLWLELRGLALLTGPSGVGKSISLRRFVADIPDRRFAVHRIGQIPTTANGFLRAVARRLGIRPRLHLADLFDDVLEALSRHEEQQGTHPVLILDDAEGMRPSTLDLLRRLTAAELDGVNHVSVLLSGTETLLATLREPIQAPLASRLGYTHVLRPFGLDDTRNYFRFHVQTAGGPDDLFTDDAIRAVFLASQGVPRQINQLALQALIEAVVVGRDAVDKVAIDRVIAQHPLYAPTRG